MLIFPAFFFYQTLVNSEFFGPVLGGYFTAGAAIAAPLLIASVWRHRLPLLSNCSVTGVLFGAFLTLFSLATIGGLQAGADEEITSSHVAYIFKFAVLFLVVRFVHAQSKWFRRFGAIIFVATIALVLATGKDGRFLQAAVLSDLTALPFLLDYQGLAYAFIVIAIYVIPQLRLEIRWLLYAGSLAALFLIGARSEFAGFIAIALVVEYCHSRVRTTLLVGVALGVLGVAVVLFLNGDSIADHRIFGLLKISADQSAIERSEMHAAALQTIDRRPFIGDYASYEAGHYAHNILSAWVDLGLLGFIAIVLLQALPLTKLLLSFRRDSRDPFYIQVLACQLFSTVLLIFAKNYTYQMIPIATGLYCRYRALQREQNRNK